MDVVFWALAAGVVMVILALGFRRTGNRARARAMTEQIRSLRGFAVQDVHVSPFSLTGVAIDRGRREVVLARADMLMQMPLGNLTAVEIIEWEAPHPDAGRDERGVAKVILRIVADNPGRPAHDIVLLDGSARARGIRRDDRRYLQARDTAEAWKRQLLTLRGPAQR